MKDTFDASKQALDFVSNKLPLKYPWNTIGLNKSFSINYSENVQYGSIVSMAYRAGKRHGKRFRVINHPEHKLYEIACVEVNLDLPKRKNRRNDSEPSPVDDNKSVGIKSMAGLGGWNDPTVPRPVVTSKPIEPPQNTSWGDPYKENKQ